jgi:hypothetical protein
MACSNRLDFLPEGRQDAEDLGRLASVGRFRPRITPYFIFLPPMRLFRPAP